MDQAGSFPFSVDCIEHSPLAYLYTCNYRELAPTYGRRPVTGLTPTIVMTSDNIFNSHFVRSQESHGARDQRPIYVLLYGYRQPPAKIRAPSDLDQGPK